MLTTTEYYQLIVNIAVLIVIANLLSHFHPFQRVILQEHRSAGQDFLISLVFVGVIIVSSGMEVSFGSFSINTRMIGAMAAGLLGGPLVGFFASMMGGLYVLLTTDPRTMASAAAFSTVCCGLLGAGFYPYFQRGKWKYSHLIVLAAFAEVFEIFSLLRLTVSMKIAVQAIMDISLPMLLVNTFGLVIFIANFNYVFFQQDAETSRQLRRIGEVTRDGIRLFRNGLYDQDNIRRFVEVLMEQFSFSGVMITDRERILQWKHPEIQLSLSEMSELPRIAVDAMKSGKLVKMETSPKGSVWESALQDNYSAAVPLKVMDQSRGCLIVWVKRLWFEQTTALQFLEIIQYLISQQLSEYELDQQQTLTAEAELKALQFQVNPHFLFNALNTISYVCRENPERAVALIRILAKYFRYSLDQKGFRAPFSNELQHVKDYLEIEKARFEEKLEVRFEIDVKSDFPIPVLTLQPIIENAVRYGIGADGCRNVVVRADEIDGGGIHVEVTDRGPGIPPGIISDVMAGVDIPDHIGLSNVNRRLCGIYGERGGLRINSSGNGTVVAMDYFEEASGNPASVGGERRLPEAGAQTAG